MGCRKVCVVSVDVCDGVEDGKRAAKACLLGKGQRRLATST